MNELYCCMVAQISYSNCVILISSLTTVKVKYLLSKYCEGEGHLVPMALYPNVPNPTSGVKETRKE